MTKTNAIRILEAANIPHSVHEYDASDGKKPFPTFIDETALLNETICVSAGRIGLQVELAPQDLANITGAAFRDLT